MNREVEEENWKVKAAVDAGNKRSESSRNWKIQKGS
jgi:hypothetical protein